jgi:hypothetical protein
MIKKIILLFCLGVFLAASCAPASAPTAEETTPQSAAFPLTPTQENIQGETGDQCIPPVATWEFAMEPPRSITPVPIVPPPSEWKVQTSLPEKDPDGYLALIEHHQAYDVIWVYDGEKYFRYRTDTRQWNTTSFENGIENDFPSWLVQDQDGKVWDLASSGHGQYLRFFRLNDNDQFELIKGSEIPGSRISDLFQKPLVRKDNTFWFLVFDSPTTMSLYSFDPNTGEAKPHLSGIYGESNPPYPFGRSIAMGQDGDIFLIRLKDDAIVRYDPDTGTSEDSTFLTRFHDELKKFIGPDLFVDRGGNLWVDDYVWIDFKNLNTGGFPTQHEIIRSPLFITTGQNDISTFQWGRPRPMLESSDGRIWFNGGAAGLVWLDPQKGLWCKFTTISSEILEDQDGNLWLLYDSNLYKYTLTP